MTETEITRDDLAGALGRARRHAGLSLRTLAEEIGVPYMAIWRTESGQWPSPANRAPIFAWLAAQPVSDGERQGEGSQHAALLRARDMRPIKVWLDDELIETIDLETRRLALTRSTYIRLALRGVFSRPSGRISMNSPILGEGVNHG